MIQTPASFSLGPVSWQRWARMGAIWAVFPLALIVYSPKAWPILVLMIPACGFALYQVKRQVRETRLTLEATGFRYTRPPNYDVTVTWPEVRAVSRRMRDGELVALSIVTVQGKYLMLGSFERLPEIAEYIESRVKPMDLDALTAFRTNPNTGWLVLGLGIAGIWMKLHYPESSDLDSVGTVLLAAAVAGIFWTMPGNFQIRRTHPVRRFLIMLAAWVVLMVALVLGYYTYQYLTR